MQIWQQRVLILLLTLSAPYAIANARTKDKSHQKGLILFLDGMPASGKSSLAKKLKELNPDFVLLSSEDLATARNKHPNFSDYVKATLDTLDKAAEIASLGQTVVVDSWITKKTLDLKSSKLFETKIYGLWCKLSCLKARYDKREGVKGAWKNSALERDCHERYANKSDKEIIESKGSWQQGTMMMSYDLFFNTEETSTEAIAKEILGIGRISD